MLYRKDSCKVNSSTKHVLVSDNHCTPLYIYALLGDLQCANFLKKDMQLPASGLQNVYGQLISMLIISKKSFQLSADGLSDTQSWWVSLNFGANCVRLQIPDLCEVAGLPAGD